MTSEDTARKAATAMKIIHLARLPGMDIVAIKLNCNPTHEEVETALRWQFALEMATDEGLTAVDLARKILEHRPRR